MESLSQTTTTSSKLKWSFYGAVFGSVFPMGALLTRVSQYGVPESYHLFLKDPLLWIIMTAPLFLGIFAFIAGKENDRVRLIQESLELANIQASKMASLGEMAGGIAHEINNPLSIIAGKTHILRARLEDCTVTPIENKNKIFDDLDKIETTAFRIAKIIKGLRAFSRNANNDEMSKFSVSSMIQDTLELCTEKFKNNGVELKLNLDSDEIQIEGRPAQLSQVILNLLNNAVDAIDALPEKWVAIDVEHGDGRVAISITDSGNGIPKAIAKKIMDPFFTTKEFGKGTGLGLSISSRIVDEHRGHFYLDEKSPHTCFKIEIPNLQPIPKSTS